MAVMLVRVSLLLGGRVDIRRRHADIVAPRAEGGVGSWVLGVGLGAGVAFWSIHSNKTDDLRPTT